MTLSLIIKVLFIQTCRPKFCIFVFYLILFFKYLIYTQLVIKNRLKLAFVIVYLSKFKFVIQKLNLYALKLLIYKYENAN